MSISGIGGGSNVGGVGPMSDPTPDNEVQNMINDLWAIASLINEGGHWGDVPEKVADLCAQWNARTDSNSWGNTEDEQKIIKVCHAICSLDNPKCLGIINFQQISPTQWHINPAPLKGPPPPTGTTWWDPGNTPRRGDPDANQYIADIIDTTLQPH